MYLCDTTHGLSKQLRYKLRQTKHPGRCYTLSYCDRDIVTKYTRDILPQSHTVPVRLTTSVLGHYGELRSARLCIDKLAIPETINVTEKRLAISQIK